MEAMTATVARRANLIQELELQERLIGELRALIASYQKELAAISGIRPENLLRLSRCVASIRDASDDMAGALEYVLELRAELAREVIF